MKLYLYKNLVFPSTAVDMAGWPYCSWPVLALKNVLIQSLVNIHAPQRNELPDKGLCGKRGKHRGGGAGEMEIGRASCREGG